MELQTGKRIDTWGAATAYDGDQLEYHYSIAVVMSEKTVLTRFEMTEGDLAVYFAGITVPAGK